MAVNLRSKSEVEQDVIQIFDFDEEEARRYGILLSEANPIEMIRIDKYYGGDLIYGRDRQSEVSYFLLTGILTMIIVSSS